MKKFVLSLGLTAIVLLVLLTSCTGGQGQKQVDLHEFAQTLLDTHEWPISVQEITLEDEYGELFLNNDLPGLLDLELEQMAVYMCTITLNNGEFSMAQAKNADDAAKVQEIFQARIDYMAGDGETPGGAFYPGPTELWTNSAQTAVNGNYVLMVCHEDCSAIVDEFNALFS